SNTPGVVFDGVGNVERVQKIIQAQQRRVNEGRRASQREKLRTAISSDLRHYVLQEPDVPEIAPAALAAATWRTRMNPFGRRPQSPADSISARGRLAAFWSSLIGTEMRE